MTIGYVRVHSRILATPSVPKPVVAVDFARVDGRNVTNPITTFHPEIAKPADRLPTQQGCGELAAGAPQLLFANLAVASGLLGAFYAWTQDQLDYEEAYFDLLTGRCVPVKRAVRGRADTPRGLSTDLGH